MVNVLIAVITVLGAALLSALGFLYKQRYASAESKEKFKTIYYKVYDPL